MALKHENAGSDRWSFRFPDRDAAQRAVAQIVAANGFVEALAPEQLSLEERFLHYVREETTTP